MATKKNINANPRAFHVAIAGNDTEDGFSIETSKATIQATIDAVNSLIPPPGVFNPSSITVSGSGFFTESNLIIPEGCQFIGTGIFNLPSTGNCFEPGSRATFEITSAGLLGGNGTVFLINNKPEIGVQAKACVVRGDGGTGVHVLGTSDIVFITISQLQLEADNAVGILDQTDNGAPEVYNINELTLEGNNTCGFRHDPTNSASQAILNAGLIGKVDSFTGTKGIEVLNGIVDAIVNNIIADDAIIVSNSSTLDIVSDHVVGNITVDAGCTLNCEILDFTGTLTNNGTIIGRIGSSNFGLGGDGIYAGSGTIPTSTIATITDTFTLNGGNVGIGITPNQGTLHVKQISDNSVGGITLVDSGDVDSLRVFHDGNNLHVENSGNANQLILGSGGDVGVGIGLPLSRLHIADGTSGLTPTSETVFTVESNVNATLNILSPNGFPGSIQFSGNGNSGDGSIFYNGGAVPGGFSFGVDDGLFTMALTNTGQIGIGIPSITPHASSILDVGSTTRGFLKPRGTELQRDAISLPAEGLEFYNLTTNEPNFFNGTVWRSPVDSGTLQDAYDNGQNITTTTPLGPVVLDNTGSTRAALTITPGTVPTTSLVSGQIYSDGTDLYLYDSVRGKFLSSSERFGFGLNGAADNEYMRVGHASDTNAAWIVPYDATITHITAFVTSGLATKGFEIQDVSGTVLVAFSLAASEFDGTQNVDIPAGTHLRAFIVAAGGTVSNSAVSVFIRRRV